MEITKILSTIKGKVLDATNYELLSSAYEIQQQNIIQLKENNTSIKENNELLKNKIQNQEETIKDFKIEISKLKSEKNNNSRE